MADTPENEDDISVSEIFEQITGKPPVESEADVEAVRAEDPTLPYHDTFYDVTGWGAYFSEFSQSLFCTVCDGKIIYINAGGLRLLHYKTGAPLLDHPVTDLLLPSEVDRFQEGIGLLLKGEIPTLPVRFLTANHSMVAVEIAAKYVENPDGETYLLEARDATQVRSLERERDAAEMQMSKLSSTDFLTGLPRGKFLKEQMEKAIARSMRKAHGNPAMSDPVALLVLDLGAFAKFNEMYGERAADYVIKTMASRLIALFRKEDLVGRGDHDQFIIMLEDIMSPDNQGSLARKMLSVLANPVRFENMEYNVNGYIGTACFPKDGHAVAPLLQAAQKALQIAKKKGPNTMQIAGEEA